MERCCANCLSTEQTHTEIECNPRGEENSTQVDENPVRVCVSINISLDVRSSHKETQFHGVVVVLMAASSITTGLCSDGFYCSGGTSHAMKNIEGIH